MSACQQAKRKRRQMKNRFAHLGAGSIPGKPIYKSVAQRSVKESIAMEKVKEARMRAAAKK